MYVHILLHVKSVPYWLDTAGPAALDRSTDPLPWQVDVAIVGGGLTGVSTAYHLAERGAQVAVLEQHEIGWGASGRNGGMCTTGMALGIVPAIERFGIDTARRRYALYDAAIDLVEKLVADEDISCDFHRHGKLSLAAKPRHYAHLEATHQALTEQLGYDCFLVPRADLRREIGSDRYWGGLVDPRGAGLHVGKFVRGLAAAAERRGALLRENVQVTGIHRLNGTAHEVRTTRGTVHAGQLLVATSGYSGHVLRRYQRRIVPIGSFVIVTEPLPAQLIDRLMPTRRMAADTKNLLYYFRITPDDRLLFGGRARFAMSNPSSDRKSGRILRAGMASVFPELADVPIDYTWGGLVDMTRDQLPHAGQYDGHYFCLGYSGHGVQMATFMGRCMAEVIGGDETANPWRDLSWPAIPGHFGKPWFLPAVGLYYRLKDRLA